MSTKYYIAYSIHGTNTFIVATIDRSKFPLNHNEFFDVQSRLPNPSTDIKLHWTKLTRKSDGQPHTDPKTIIKKFNELKKLGWEIDDAKFRERHFKKKAVKKTVKKVTKKLVKKSSKKTTIKNKRS